MKKMRRTKKSALPLSFRPLFWSYRFRDLDIHEDTKLIIKQILLYGDLRQLRWMVKAYTKEKIRNILSRIPETELRPSSVEFAKTVFHITSMPHVRRVSHKRS